MSFENIPNEMKLFAQWIVWRLEDLDAKKPTKIPYSALNGRLASVTDPSTWCDFKQALIAFQSGLYSGIGFVLTEADPFAFVDLDDVDGDPELLKKQVTIYEQFNSYSERSPSGKGLHIICKGKLPSGRKRSSIEVYSNLRYMTMTGDVFNPAPIEDRDALINALWHEMGKGRKTELFYAGLEHAENTDEEILEMAAKAANAEKFNDLFYEGNWQKWNYPSQSEADFALFDIIAFYSKNGAQTKRIFLQSKLAEREKSKADYRIKYMLDRCFDRMLPPVDLDGLQNQLNEILAQKQAEQKAKSKSLKNEIVVEFKPLVEPEKPLPKNEIYSIPPGILGEIANFIYSSSPRPVAEISLAAAIGLMAGIVGRAYNVSGTGLNQYVLTIAPTGTGKEAVAKGIDKIIAEVLKVAPSAGDFIGPGEIASHQAIIKYMSKGPNSFVSIVGEFGLYMQQMTSPNAPPHLLGLRRFLLDAYNKSGENNVIRPTIYSDKANNTSEVYSPAFSILGESTPEKFYEGLHEGLISEGLLPRFTLIEYNGDRPALNENFMNVDPSADLIQKVAQLCAHSLMLNSQNKAIHVDLDEQAKDYFRRFDKHCDLQINSAEREIKRHLWNRAHIKSLKLAALVAVGLNPYDPTIDINCAVWATNIICADVNNFIDRFNAGEIGTDNDETKQLKKLIDTFKEFVISPWHEVSKYSGEKFSNLHSARIIPFAYIQRKLAAVSVFRKDRIGSNGALKRALGTLIERGDIQEVSRSTLSKDYGTTSRAFAISNPKSFGF